MAQPAEVRSAYATAVALAERTLRTLSGFRRGLVVKMESITNIRDVLVPFFGILIISFFLIGIIVSLKYMTNVLDAKGAIYGLKKSILYYILAIISAAIMLLLSDQEYFYASLCFLFGGSIFILLFFGIQYLQMKLVLNRSEKQKKYEE